MGKSKMTLDEKELKEVEERCNKATPGPWYAININSLTISTPKTAAPNADESFICYSRTDIPTLIAAVRELQSENKALREVLKWYSQEKTHGQYTSKEARNVLAKYPERSDEEGK